MYGSRHNFYLMTMPKVLLVGYLNMNNMWPLFSGTLQYFMGKMETGVEINNR